jgi:HAD superfamily hydrolase (TIGR01509 family)
MVKAIIFDCFGVLVTEAWLPFKQKHFGHDPALLEHATRISHQADRGLISRQEAISQTAELAGITPAEFTDAIGHNVPNEELFDYLRQLKACYKIGFLSNISDDYLHQIFNEEHLALFDGMELSYKTGVIKPSAGAYGNAATGLGVEAGECVMIDDQPGNVEGARRAGMQAVLYKNMDQLKQDLPPLLKAS